jgi:hypothetical protein
MKDQMMLKIPNMFLADPEVTKHSARLDKPVPVGEIMEINTTWLRLASTFSSSQDSPQVWNQRV